jgi:hypothetical protein
VPDAHRLGGDAELAGNLGLADASGEQLSGSEPTGLESVTLSLCRSAARDSRHVPILACRQPRSNSTLALTPSTRHPGPFKYRTIKDVEEMLTRELRVLKEQDRI